MRWRLFLTVVAILGTLVGAWCYLTLDESHYWVEYVVPNGYHGIITFELDPDHGVVPAVKGGNTYVYRIPDSGTLKVRDFDLFERYHHEIAQYADGRSIRSSTSGGKSWGIRGPGDIALYDLGSLVQGKQPPRQYVCVGTFHDCQVYHKQLSGE